jgi:5-methyltetrahydropteroyltriglutamate--homocysteine methyltransferase
MRRSTDRILTTHVGSLSRPNDLIELYSNNAPPEQLYPRLKAAVSDVVMAQVDAGIDIVNDGEFGKPSRATVDYGAFWSYIYPRLTGYEMKEVEGYGPFASMDRKNFREFYESGEIGRTIMSQRGPMMQQVCTGPIKYIGHDLIKRDIENLKAALAEAGLGEGFIPAVSPGQMQIRGNQYYKTNEEYVQALCDAMREEYKAIVDAGLIVQIDDPAVVQLYDWWYSETNDLDGYRDKANFIVEALNYSLRDLPAEQIRYHICWGSWHGPHSTDIPLADAVDIVLKVRAGGYSFEAGNVRHEHEWKVWRDAKLPDGRVIIPGVVSHATNVLEHPELIADRIVHFAEQVGRENVIAGTDCGLGGRIHPQLAWAKLRALSEGAALASKRLWS